MWVPRFTQSYTGIEQLTQIFLTPCSTYWACVHSTTVVRLRRPATLTTVCPVWCCKPLRPPSRLWRAARPARNQPAATPWQLPYTCPSSPGSAELLSLPAGCCPWRVWWGPWRGAGPVQAARILCRDYWVFDLSHRCGGGYTGLQDETWIGFILLWNSFECNFYGGLKVKRDMSCTYEYLCMMHSSKDSLFIFIQTLSLVWNRTF